MSDIAVSISDASAARGGHRLRVVLLLICIALVAFGARTAVAAAATVNTRADRSALHAYANYLSQLNSQLGAVRSHERQLGQLLSCRAVFIAGASHGTMLDGHTEVALEDEVDELVALRAVSLTASPLTRLKRHLQLMWSTPVYVVDTDEYLSAEARFIKLGEPGVCAAARDAASAPGDGPANAVLTYITRYVRTYKTAKNSQRTFVNKVLVRNEAAGDLALIKRINHLANVYQKRITSITEAESATIETKLGLS